MNHRVNEVLELSWIGPDTIQLDLIIIFKSNFTS